MRFKLLFVLLFKIKSLPQQPQGARAVVLYLNFKELLCRSFCPSFPFQTSTDNHVRNNNNMISQCKKISFAETSLLNAEQEVTAFDMCVKDDLFAVNFGFLYPIRVILLPFFYL